ncbi:MAG: hypothetical protein ACYTBZ_04050 [Planctomycetota bacterium]
MTEATMFDNAPSSLVTLLRQWNHGDDIVSEEEVAQLVNISQLELGLSQDLPAFHATSIAILANQIKPHLPTVNGRTVADVYGEVCQLAADDLDVAVEFIQWDSGWGDLVETHSKGILRSDDSDLDMFLSDLLGNYNDCFGDPHELVGETVRSIWKARDGIPFWELSPYEENWCASQGVFHDVRRIPIFARSAEAVSESESKCDRIKPATPLDTLVNKDEFGTLLHSIETHFGVWLGRYPKEGRLPVLIAGTLISPIVPIIAGCIVHGLLGDVRGLLFIAGGVWACCWGIAAILYFRSQPRLPSEVKTIKDLVRSIVRKRRETVTKPRFRPVTPLR